MKEERKNKMVERRNRDAELMRKLGLKTVEEHEREKEERPKFNVVTADPPWFEQGGGKVTRGAQRHYDLMKTDAIIELLISNCEPMARVDEEKSAFFLWVTNNFLLDGLRVMDALGYRYITNLVWAKDRSGLGYYFHGQHELCLFGVKGKWGRPTKVPGINSTLLGSGLITHPKDKNGKIIHSRKPPQLAEMIEQRFGGPYLELFARENRPGWEAWGKES
jgi:N6-adenosine-specific RNA methylase IME4